MRAVGFPNQAHSVLVRNWTNFPVPQSLYKARSSCSYADVRPLHKKLRVLSALSRPELPAKTPKIPDGSWEKVVAAEKAGETVSVTVRALNKGGLVVSLFDVKGFLPYNQLASGTAQPGAENALSYLVGKTLQTKVISVEAEKGRKDFVVSEKKAQQSEAMRSMKLGKVMKAIVRSVEEYGVFVELVDLPGVTGLVHKTELSWDPIMTVDSVVKTGQLVQVMVIELDAAKCRLGLSVRQTQPDPIKVTLETVQWGPTRIVLPEIQQLIDVLKALPGVVEVRLGRQATEAKIASQELVVYLTKEMPTEEGFDAVARLGNVVQELYVAAKVVTKEEARALLARAVQLSR
ncbi:hypothetical protein CEUSTIGMA_g2873.t1 [Chlamydomonas eustigma]|uniref:S1 motif domain-containing protein n=1 Tax=Chlamydomonas eustigma TaxID=1157962 RepID=A0A250WXK1_9CHLO|nr:hypothetical protein CEUSTIGMA_g2873.t1 [Chlamydomonas eustigma]|eukprot:GAX75429.1 hypothetical protein CEUSTIGMA_g2873.t1 [Chlamydomonas eustigma]